MGSARTFGATWWGQAWLDALEQRALLDPTRLPRGRTYARQDRVRSVELGPGLLRAEVWGGRPEPYVTSLSMRTLSDPEWDRLLDLATRKAGTIATLLAGEVPRELSDLVLPDRGDLGPECSCPDLAEPCKHAAALCYVASEIFDQEPFAMLTLRGRSRESILREVRARRSDHLGVAPPEMSDLPRGPDPGVPASTAFRREPIRFTRTVPLVGQPAPAARLGVSPGVDTGIDVHELADLVADAASRAWSMLAEDASSQLHISVGADVVRRAASGDFDRVVAATGVDENELRAAVAAWRVGGVAGFNAFSHRPDIAPALMERGRAALGEGARIQSNQAIKGRVQLRCDEGHRWWRFVADADIGWRLTDGPADDPNELV